MEKRLRELAMRSRQRNIFVFSDFLTEGEQQFVKTAFPQEFVHFFGGAQFAERKMACFGEGQPPQPPLCVLKLHPQGGKFTQPMGHRDVLGALMALGIVREKVGDIFCGEDCFAVVHQSVAQFVLQNLVQVGRNNVEVSFGEVPQTAIANRKSLRVSAQSNRLDALCGKVFNLSREKAADLVRLGLVAVDGVPCTKGERPLKMGEKVSVRGCGKFVFAGEGGTGKKGRTIFEVEVFV